MSKIFVISWGGYDAPDVIDIYDDEGEFLNKYKAMHTTTRANIHTIIKGTEYKVAVHKKEVVREWKLCEENKK